MQCIAAVGLGLAGMGAEIPQLFERLHRINPGARCGSIPGVTGRGDERALAESAKDALRQGRPEEAAAILNEARQKLPRDPTTLRTLVDVALVLGDGSAAADLLDAAIAAHGPGVAPPAWYRLLGETRAVQGRLDEAIGAFRATLAAWPDDVDTWRWTARVLRAVNDLPATLLACRRVVGLAPDDWQARVELANVLTETRAFDEAAAWFDEAAERESDAPAVIIGRARLDMQRGRRPEAISALEACVARHPSHVLALGALALGLRHERRFDDALAVYRQALDLTPADATLWCGLGRTLLEAGRAGEARDTAAAYLTRRRGHAGALALEALARLALGDEEGAGRLLDYDRFVVRRRLAVPEGFADLASFNVALAAVARAHPTLHRAPVSHATAAGLHSGSLLVDPPHVIKSLQQAFRAAVADYYRSLPDWPEHPFVSRRPVSAFFDIWCVVMERGGHQIPHIHPEAWLSGVYYPELPDVVRTGPGPEGWLAFGEPDHEFPRRVDPRIVHVGPEEGLLVLFPSYFYHRTIPFGAEGTRVSVAFDLVPTDT